MPKLFNYHRYENFLDIDVVNTLLEYCLINEGNFNDARLGNSKTSNRVYKDYRICLVNNDLGQFEELIKQRILNFLPDFYKRLNIKPFEVTAIELQIAAHGDGAFFKQHIDTHTEIENNSKSRVISAVFYFFTEPKKFKGGELVLHPFPFLDGSDTSVILKPISNSLVIFPSFGMHEVLKVNCPDLPFQNWRFAINCWINN